MSIFGHKEPDGTLNYRVSGPLVRDPELNQKGDRVKFSVAYGKKKYMNVQAYVNTPAGELAGCLEKGDHVSVDGVYETWGEGGKYGALKADFLEVQAGVPVQAVQPGQAEEAEQESRAPSEDSGRVDWSELGEPDFELEI